LAGVWAGSLLGPFVMLALTAFLTAFYMFRVVFLAFFGQPHPGGHPHEAPPLMVIPLWILAALTTVMGLRLAFGGAAGEHHGPPWLAPFSLALAASGLLVAWALYQRRLVAPERVAAVFPLNVLHVLARHRYGIDALYAGLYRAFILGLSRLVGWIDRYVVDGLVNFWSAWTLRGGDLLRRIQSGRAQDYVYGVAFGVLLLFVWAQWIRR
jgi:NADH-quinone oxidoreductase subunit L